MVSTGNRLLSLHVSVMAENFVPIGKRRIAFELPDHLQAEVIAPKVVEPDPHPMQAVTQALNTAVGGFSLENFRGANSAAIAINDKTRPVPHQHLLPPLLEAIEGLGIPPARISLWIAVGAHPRMLPNEFPTVLPESIIGRYPVFSHDCDDEQNLAYLGDTQRGTPVWINRSYSEAGLKVVVGNIEPHQFQGFSGGVKSAAIGLAGRKTIRHNHAMMVSPTAQLGRYQDNEPRQDIEEIGRMAGIHLALNAILNKQKEIVQVVAGAPQAVMHEGIPLARDNCQVGVAQMYDLMIVSPGGHPKDINLYQAQKALAHAALVTRPGGTIILAAACPEGTGSSHYEDWMIGHTSYEQVIQRFREEGFRIGPHKAFQIARDAAKFRLMFYSDMEEALARSLLLNPVQDFQTAVNLALSNLPPGGRIGILPFAASTIPYVEQKIPEIQ